MSPDLEKPILVGVLFLYSTILNLTLPSIRFEIKATFWLDGHLDR
jgi:hypothetical protein